MYSIGEFSRITGLSPKALRLYHERGLLVPGRVDPGNGYRYYQRTSVDKARAIAQLRAMTFSLDEIQTIVGACDDDADVLVYLQEKAEAIASKMSDLQHIAQSIEAVVTTEKESQKMSQQNQFEVEEKQVADMLIASIRWRGRYEESGKYFGKLYKAVGRHVAGKPMGLYYDREYKEEDADMESCVPVRKGRDTTEVKIRKLAGGPCISLIHKGPYTEIGRSYQQLMQYAKDKGFQWNTPSREIYRKGPGMIFKGNPKNYLTEIQFVQ